MCISGPQVIRRAVWFCLAILLVAACTPPDGDDVAGGDDGSTVGPGAADAAASGDDGDPTATGTAASSGPTAIVVGAVMADSGLARHVDRPALAAVQVEVDRINAAGGIDGRPVELRAIDSETEFNATYGAAVQLAEDGAVALLVTCDYDFATPALDVAAAYGIPAVSPCGSDPRWRSSGAFSAGAGTDAEGRLLADVASERTAGPVAVVVDTSDPEMTAMCDAFTARFTAAGGTISAEFAFDRNVVALFDPEIIEPDPDLTGVAAADLVVLCGSLPSTGPAMLEIMRERDITAPVITGSAMDGSDWLRDGLGDVTFLSWGSTFRNDPSEEVDAVVEGVRATIGGSAEGGRMVAGADAGVALLRALERDVLDPAAQLVAMAGEELSVATASWSANGGLLDERPLRLIRVDGDEGVVDEVRVAP